MIFKKVLFVIFIFAININCIANALQSRKEIFNKYNKIVNDLFLKKCYEAQSKIMPQNLFKCENVVNNQLYSYEILNNFYIINIATEQSLLDLYNEYACLAEKIPNKMHLIYNFNDAFKKYYFLPNGYLLKDMHDFDGNSINFDKKPYFYEYFFKNIQNDADEDFLKISNDFKNEIKIFKNTNKAIKEFIEQNPILNTENEISKNIDNKLQNLETLQNFMNEKLTPETKEKLNKITTTNLKNITYEIEKEDFTKRYNSIGLLYLSNETYDEDIDYSNIEQLEKNKNYIFLNRGIKQYDYECNKKTECDKTVKLNDNEMLISYNKRKHYILVKGKTEENDGAWDLLKYKGTKFVKDINKKVAYFTKINDTSVFNYSSFIIIPNHIR